LIFDDPATSRAAELIPFEGNRRRGEEVSSVQIVVAQEFKGGAMQLVGSGTRGELHAGARPRLACREIRRFDSEFLKRVRIGEYWSRAEVDVGVTQTIQLEGIVRAAVAIDGHLTVRGLEVSPSAGIDGARGQADKLQRIAPVQRKFPHAPA